MEEGSVKEDCLMVFVHPNCYLAARKIGKIFSELGFVFKHIQLTCEGNVFKTYPMPAYALKRLKQDPQNNDDSLFLSFHSDRNGFITIDKR